MNDNFLVNPFSSDVISPTLHCVLNLMKEANLLTVAPMNQESKPVFFLGSA